MHINAISCGQGGPSVFLIVMAGRGDFQADAVIVADTGWENDMLWSNGNRTTAKQYFDQVTKPLAESYNIPAYFVRSRQFDGTPYPPLKEAQLRPPRTIDKPENKIIDIPLYGSMGGQLRQTCTSKWKIQAIKQQLRALGADTATTALGLHLEEVHRLKPGDGDWYNHMWPLVDLMQYNEGVKSMGIGRKYRRGEIENELNALSIPFLLSTECDGCPHKDWPRWERTAPAVIDSLAEWEKSFENLYLTDERVPLKEALEIKRRKWEMRGEGDQLSLFDGCDSGYCFT